MSRLTFSVATALCAASFLGCPVIGYADAADSNPESSIPNTPGLSAKYLPAYTHIGNGLSWAGHLDSEIFSNFSGGIKQGSEGNIVGQIGAEYDTDKAGLWKGGKFTLSLMGIYSSGIQQNYSGDIQTASNIWAPNAVRFYDAAYRQRWNDWLNTRVGYMDVNYYFDVAANALQLINSSFGMSPTITVNVPGTATYPYSGLGLLVSTHTQNVSNKLAIFQGDPQHQTSAFERGYMALWEGALHWGHKADEDMEDNTDEYGQYEIKIGAWRYQQANPNFMAYHPAPPVPMASSKETGHCRMNASSAHSCKPGQRRKTSIPSPGTWAWACGSGIPLQTARTTAFPLVWPEPGYALRPSLRAGCGTSQHPSR
jgi:Carbohydrate-selective porin